MKNLYCFLFCSFVFLMSTTLFAQTNVSGNVSGTWTTASSPYLITDDIVIIENTALTISPGVEVKFQGHYKLTVEGVLTAEGNGSAEITFTASDTLEGWGGIVIDNSQNGASGSLTDSIIFSHCIFEYAHATGSYPNNCGAALSVIDYDKVGVFHSVFEKNTASMNGGAIYCYNSDIAIAFCFFEQCFAVLGGAIYSSNSQPVLFLNRFENNSANNGGAVYFYSSDGFFYGNGYFSNTATAQGGALYFTYSDPSITNDSIQYNSSGSNGGGLYLSGADPIITNSNISYNLAGYNGGGFYATTSNGKAIGCIITNNQAVTNGGGVALINSNFDQSNSSIVSNLAGTAGGGFYLFGSSPVFTNSIVWGNGASNGNQILRLSGNPDFYNCCISAISGIGGNGAYLSNISSPPLFTSPSNGIGICDTTASGASPWWALDYNSPCINSGTVDTTGLSLLPQDQYGANRIAMGQIDMGATECSNAIASCIIASNTTWDADTVFINCLTTTILSNSTLTVLPGTVVEFNVHGKIDVLGKLIANGTENDSIKFTANNHITGWKGIYIDNSSGSLANSDSSLFSYCIFEHGHSDAPAGTSSSTNIDYFGGAISVQYFDFVEISNSCFRNNSGHYGGAIQFSNCSILIENNIFYDNSSAYVGGAVSGYSSTPCIVGNIIYNNNAKYGGGIRLTACQANLINNTICNNYADTEGGGIYLYDSGNTEIINCIVYGNKGSIGNQIHAAPTTTYTINNCNVEGGIGNLNPTYAVGNIYSDPIFKNPTNQAGLGALPQWGTRPDWSLIGTSPCIDMGTTQNILAQLPTKDIFGKPRIENNIIDMGATEICVITADCNINSSTTWDADTVIVDCNVMVSDNATLNIAPGTSVCFAGAYEIEIHGQLLAEGNTNDSILFTATDQTIGWGGIVFDNSATGADGAMDDNKTSQIAYCIFEHAKTNNANRGGAISSYYFEKLNINNSCFRNNRAIDGTVLIQHGFTSINNNLFRNNTATNDGGAINLNNSSVDIRDCTFSNNTCTDDGGALYSKYSSPTISNCSFRNNTSSDKGGALYSNDSSPKISNSTFRDNTSINWGGAICARNGVPEIIGNIIHNNESNKGGAIYTDNSTAFIINNTICNNKALTNGGGIFMENADNSEVVNSIIYGNEASSSSNGHQICVVTTSVYSVTNCDIEGGISGFSPSTNSNNINTDPLFANPTTATGATGTTANGAMPDWGLQIISPCVDEGTNSVTNNYDLDFDLIGNQRVQHDLIDIGAIETISVYAECSIVNHTTWDEDTIYVECDVTVADHATLTIMPGTCVKFIGDHKLDVQGQLIAEGTHNDSILFSAYDKVNGWKGIYFNNSSTGANGAMDNNSASKITYCIFEHGHSDAPAGTSSTSNIDYHGGAICAIEFDSLEISNSLFRKNSAHYGGAIQLDRCSIAITNCIFFKNIGLEVGGAISAYKGNPILAGNIMCNNEGKYGGAIRATKCTMKAINNTICNNFSSYRGGGIYHNDADNSKIANCIVYGNEAVEGEQIFSKDTGSDTLTNSNIEDLSSLSMYYEGGNNISSTPNFTDPTLGSGVLGVTALGNAPDWSLKVESPCVDAGTIENNVLLLPDSDLIGNPRFSNDSIDIGAIELKSIVADCNITTSTTWDADIIYVNCNVTVADDVTLTIPPGKQVVFNGHYKIDIRGQLLAEGNASDSILFTASTPSTGWQGLYFDNSATGANGAMTNNGQSKISYCIFEHGNSDAPENETSFNELEYFGGAIAVFHFDKLKISNCCFRDNKAYYGGAIKCNYSSISIVNSTFYNNSGSVSGAIDVYKESPTLIGNIVANNNSEKGGGIRIHSSSAIILNNTICNNYASIEGGGIILNNADSAKIINSIIYNNASPSGPQIANVAGSSDFDLKNSNIEGLTNFGGSGDYQNNFDSDPLFINPTTTSGINGIPVSGSQTDWSLANNSPCINAGLTAFYLWQLPSNDLYGNARVDDNTVDVGALETTIDPGCYLSALVTWNTDTIYVNCNITVADNATLTIAPGTVVIFTDTFKIDVRGRLLAEGNTSESILFTAQDPVIGWRGIYFDNSPTGANGAMDDNDTSKISYCIFEHGISNAPSGTGSTSNKEYMGGALYAKNITQLKISNSCFRNNSAYFGGALHLEDCSIAITNNKFFNNKGHEAGGAISASSGQLSIVGNIMCNNEGEYGGAIRATNCNMKTINNTISNNHSSYRGGGIYMNNADDSKIANCIIYGNEAVEGEQIYSKHTHNDQLYYCNIENISALNMQIDSIGNISSPPKFINATTSVGVGGTTSSGAEPNWVLQANSPCIDAGTIQLSSDLIPNTDLNGNQRIFDSSIDIGATESHYIYVDCNVHSSTTWDHDTVYVTCDVTVADTATLSITPGTVVIFAGRHKIDVQGRLLAEGTCNDSIVFSAQDHVTGWQGIYFDNSSGGGNGAMDDNGLSKISYCIFEHGHSDAPAGTINFNNPDFYGGAISIFSFDDLEISRCCFRKNTAHYGGAIKCNHSSPIIENCTFFKNSNAYAGGAIDIYKGSATIVGNIIVNNEAEKGGGIRLYQSSAIVLNNTICNNVASTEGGGIYLYYADSAQIINSIIYGNDSPTEPQIYNDLLNSNFDLINCDVEGLSNYGGLGTFCNNIDAYPAFTNPTTSAGINGVPASGNLSDWNLLSNSPCINGGTDTLHADSLPINDIYGNPRINSDFIDIGATETILDPACYLPGSTTWNSDTILITCNVTVPDNATLTIAPGTVVLFTDNYRINIYGLLLAEGTSNDSILFTATNPSTGWQGIYFDNSSTGANGSMDDNGTSKISYCIFEHGHSDAPPGTTSSSNIDHYGGAICAMYINNLEISNSCFQENSAFFGGAMQLIHCSITIKNNKFYNNIGLEAGGAISAYKGTPNIVGNIMCNNEGEHGGAIRATKCTMKAINNTICNNLSSYRGGGIYMNDADDSKIANCIIYGNEAIEGEQIFSKSTGSDSLYHCNIENIEDLSMQIDSIGNISKPPAFKNATTSAGVGGLPSVGAEPDWGLLLESPCINKGTTILFPTLLPSEDLLGNPRVNNDEIDIGAIESDYVFADCSINSSTTWDNDTVFVGCDVTVAANATLTITPGTKVIFLGHHKIDIQGRLLAEGTSSNSITFSALDQVTGWHGIYFDNSNSVLTNNDISKISYCVFEHGHSDAPAGTGSTSDIDYHGGALCVIEFDKLEISSSLFRNNSAHYGGAIQLSDCNITITNNIFYNNIGHEVGGAISAYSGNPIIVSNIMCNNEGEYGGAIRATDCTMKAINNTICNNSSSYRGGGIYYNNADNSKIANCIIYGNEAPNGEQIFSKSTGSDSLYHCNVENISSLIMEIDSIGNISLPPAFINPTTGAGTGFLPAFGNEPDWRLQAVSPCLNIGSQHENTMYLPALDLLGNTRITNDSIDMGALESNYEFADCSINSSTTWDNDTIYVKCDVTVADNTTLTIAPGTVILFLGHYKIDIQGKLLAEGTENNSIVFTAKDHSEGWQGIYFDNSSSGANGAMDNNGTSKFSYCIFEHGHSDAPAGTISSTNIDYFGGAISVQYFDHVEIKNSCFRYNSGHYGGAIQLNNSSILIKNNIFHDNSSAYVGGAISGYYSSPSIIGNLIYNNYTQSYGGGLRLFYCDADLINNTICNNSSSTNGGGVYLQNANNTKIVNCIIYGNEATNGQQIYEISTTPYTVKHCNIEGGTSSFGPSTDINNVAFDPLFVNPTTSAGTNSTPVSGSIPDWNLLGYSPCINMGQTNPYQSLLSTNDVYGNPRIDNDSIDIGAAESSIDPNCYIANQTTWSNTRYVDCDVTVADNATLSIAPGTSIIFTGNYKIDIRGQLLAEGNASDSIWFTAVNTSTSWKGIYFDNSTNGANGEMSNNNTSKFAYCAFEHAHTNSTDCGGAINSYSFDKLEIANSSFRNNSAQDGAAILLKQSSVSIANCTFRNQSALNNGGAIYINQGTPTIINSSFSENIAIGDGGAIYCNGGDVKLAGNILHNNEAVSGGAIYFQNGKARIINNTICNNHASNNGGGVYMYSADNSEIINSIVCSNTANYSGDQIYEQSTSSYSTIYCNLGGGNYGFNPYPDNDNISTDPNFVNPTMGSGNGGITATGTTPDWGLLVSSPCINAGKPDTFGLCLDGIDLAGTQRVIGDTIDMGAYEYGVATTTSSKSQSICLDQGWNIFSTYIDNTELVDTVMSDIREKVILMKDENGSVFWPWFNLNLINQMTVGKGYQINVTEPVVLTVEGDQVEPDTTGIVLHSGFNMMAYLRDNPAPVDQVMNSIVPGMVIMKDEHGMVFWPYFNLNLIGNMVPGEGYQVKLNTQLTFYYPSNSTTFSPMKNAIKKPEHYACSMNTGNNMTLGLPLSCWEQKPQEGDEVGVFDNEGNLLGAGVFDQANMAIAVWGKDEVDESSTGLKQNENFHLKYWKKSEGKEFDMHIQNWEQGSNAYTENGIAIAGKAEIESSDKEFSFKCYPNPVSDILEIDFTLPEAGMVKIELYTTRGELIKELESSRYSQGCNTFSFPVDGYSTGSYGIRIKYMNNSETQLISITK